MEITPEKIVEIASYFTVVSHVPGRLRVRVNPKIKDEAKDITIEDIETISQKISGIKKIKINKVIASVTIEYEHSVFEKRLWDDLISGENLEEVVAVIEKLKKEVS